MFGIFLITDIPEHGLNTNHITQGTVDRCLPDFDVNRFPVANLMPFNIVVQLPRLNHAPIIGHVFFCKVCRKKIEICFPNELRDRNANLFASLCVGVLDSPPSVLA